MGGTICEKCGGVKHCTLLGCHQKDHYHCNCTFLLNKGQETDKEKFMKRKIKEALDDY